MERKIWIRRSIYLLLAAFCLAFGMTWDNRFCLGDVVLGVLGLPAWSQGTQGFHYPGVVSALGVLICFYLFAATTRDKGKTMANLILCTAVLLWVLSMMFGR